MKLVRFGPPGHEHPGIWLENTPSPGEASILDVRAMAFDIEDYDGHFFSRWGIDRLRGLLRESRRKTVPADGVRLGPPIARPGKIICLGKNYANHAAEFDAELPDRPILFAKAATALTGPFDPISLPPGSKVVDVEVELAVVIGSKGRNVTRDQAMSLVAGYTILNDVTDREAQRADKQWFRAKSFDTFCLLGPFLVTPDEVSNPRNLNLYSKINSQGLQQSNTSHMIFDLAHVISYVSATMTLEPGDVIATGTPGGIGSARKPPVVLHAGDTVEIGVDRLGVQRCRVVSA
jgi:2,4-didehydro-3-deoxy-L-rhamnonate hydrolase